MSKPIPDFATDEEAEAFIDNADLSEFDLSGFVPARFVLATDVVSLHLPSQTVADVKEVADRQGVTADSFMRRAIEAALLSAK
jgi:predicted DNA binding CopG/RHH family protein